MTITDCVTNQATVPLQIVRDILAPVAVITATTGMTPSIHVQWSAADPTGGAGVRDYDVAYAVDDGDWTGWFTDTQESEGWLTGAPGHAYPF